MVTNAAFDRFVYYAGPIVQLLYWVVMAAVAVWAVLLLKRFVDHKVAKHTAHAPAPTPESRPTISIDEFVD